MTKRMWRRAADERGQSLVIVTLAMVVVLGMAAVAIDVATWYQKHHQAQVAADAAALAGANCMATGSCTSSSAPGIAQSMCGNNGVATSDCNVSVNVSASTVTVTATTRRRPFSRKKHSAPPLTPSAFPSRSPRDCCPGKPGKFM